MQKGRWNSSDTRATELEGQANQLEITIESTAAEAEKQAVASQVQNLREESAELRQKAQTERAQALQAEGHVPIP